MLGFVLSECVLEAGAGTNVEYCQDGKNCCAYGHKDSGGGNPVCGIEWHSLISILTLSLTRRAYNGKPLPLNGI